MRQVRRRSFELSFRKSHPGRRYRRKDLNAPLWPPAPERQHAGLRLDQPRAAFAQVSGEQRLCDEKSPSLWRLPSWSALAQIERWPVHAGAIVSAVRSCAYLDCFAAINHAPDLPLATPKGLRRSFARGIDCPINLDWRSPGLLDPDRLKGSAASCVVNCRF